MRLRSTDRQTKSRRLRYCMLLGVGYGSSSATFCVRVFRNDPEMLADSAKRGLSTRQNLLQYETLATEFHGAAHGWPGSEHPKFRAFFWLQGYLRYLTSACLSNESRILHQTKRTASCAQGQVQQHGHFHPRPITGDSYAPHRNLID